MHPATRNTSAKALRLLHDGRVTAVNDDGTLWLVRGDHDTYLVALPDSQRVRAALPAGTGRIIRATCSCPSDVESCSHVVAARQARAAAQPAPADPFAGIT